MSRINESASEVIEYCLVGHGKIGRCNALTEEIVKSLEKAGYVIVRKDCIDRMCETVKSALAND